MYGWAVYIGDPKSQYHTGAIAAKSGVIRLASHSTLESEAYGADEVCKFIVWVREHLSEHGFPQNTTTIFTDNQAVIQVMKNPILHQRTRHFRMRLAFVRQLVMDQKIEFVYVSTHENEADTLTKALGVLPFQKHRDSLMGNRQN